MSLQSGTIKTNLHKISSYLFGIRQHIAAKKIKNPLIAALLIVAAVACSYIITFSGIKGAVIIMAVIIGLPVIAAILISSRVGVIVMLIMAYLLMGILRIGIDFPLGTLMDGLQALLIISFFFKQKTEKNWKSFKNPISIMILIWIGYNLLEVLNPVAESSLAWVYTVRSTAVVTLMYFIFLHNIRTISFLRLILKLWLALSLFAALYAFKQEYFGFFNFENQWLQSNPRIRELLFIGDRWRKFSIFSDPVSFAYNMAISGIFCIALLTGPFSRRSKIILTGMAVFFLTVMLYSGTRGAYILVPSSLILLAILRFNRKIMMYTGAAAVFMMIMVKIPTSNPTLYRFQTAFKPSTDESYNVRKKNQKLIQPYILSHPMGGGLGATGVWGQRFAPGSFLANFPPDSGYVRTAVELGSIGLLLFCIFIFICLLTGINNYYKIHDPELKTYCLAMTMVIFALNIGNYPQEALVQFPISIYFYFFLAVINATLLLYNSKQQT